MAKTALTYVVLASTLIALDKAGETIKLFPGDPLPANFPKDEIDRLIEGGYIGPAKAALQASTPANADLEDEITALKKENAALKEAAAKAAARTDTKPDAKADTSAPKA